MALTADVISDPSRRAKSDPSLVAMSDPAPRSWTPARRTVDAAVLAAITLAALAVRLPGIVHQPLQWDEGWSVALARLSVAEAVRLTALDVHPPLYYALLHLWQSAVGSTPFALRALSLLAGTLAVPLGAAAARAWWPVGRGPATARRVAGWAAALAVALAPPLVYYAGVGRMYALAAAGVFAAVWGVGAWIGIGGPPAPSGPEPGPGHGPEREPEPEPDLDPEPEPEPEPTLRRRHRRLPFAVAVGGSAGALLSFYYSGFALAGLGLAALLARPGAWRRLAAWAGLSTMLVGPWLAFALPPLIGRMSARAAAGGGEGVGSSAVAIAIAIAVAGGSGGGGAGLALGPLWEAWRAVLFVNTGAGASAALVAVVLFAGLVAMWLAAPGDGPARGRLAAVVLPVLLVCAAAALGARAHMFAPRYVSIATPLVAIGFGWLAAGAWRLLRPGLEPGPWPGWRRAGGRGRDQGRDRDRDRDSDTGRGRGKGRGRDRGQRSARGTVPAALALALALTVVGAAWPTLSGAIHSRSAEWFEAYDPSAIHKAVVEVARPRDVVAFNILSLAGAYDSAAAGARASAERVPSPPWTYAQLWDPVHEPVKPARQRVEDAFEAALRGESPGTAALWLVLYKGTAAADTAALKAWADEVYFPHGGRWVGDTLLAGFIEAPTDVTRHFDPPVELDAGITLRRVRHTARAPAGGNVAVALRWRALAAPRRDARVVVSLIDDQGIVVARRESVPVSESRPISTWQAGETLDDRHGMRLPIDVAGPRSLRLVVGLVDAASGAVVGDVDVGEVHVDSP